MTKDEALRMALEALGQLWLLGDEAAVIANPAITAIKQARSAPVQEPVAWEAGFSVHDGIITGGVSDLERFRALARNATLDEIADKIALMPFGDTAASFAVWIKEQKT